MKQTPPFLLGAALLFWGWQTGLLAVGALMAVVVESARWLKVRWDFSDQDFTRAWVFCALLCLGAALYAFTSNQGPAELRGFLQHPSFFDPRNSSTGSARSVAAVLRWLPMIFFLFIAAQIYSSREGVPVEVVSLIMRRRWRKARRLGQPIPANRNVNVSYPYFVLCLLAASIHPSVDESSNRSGVDETFFWGCSLLVAWALWPQRSRRFGLVTWAVALAAAVGLGYAGQRGLGQLQRYAGNFNPEWLSDLMRHRAPDPFRSRTSLGRVGRLKLSGKIVIRLETKTAAAPPYLREASYRAYKSPTWFSGVTSNDFTKVLESTSGNYELLPGKTNVAAVNIGCYLAGGLALLPLPSGSGRLENLAAFDLQKSPLGAVMAQGPNLVMFDARYGPGTTMDAPGNTNEDLAVPPKEIPALERVITNLNLNGKPLETTLKDLHRLFLDQFTYSTWQEPDKPGTNDTPLSRFLLRAHSGHCEYFATAGVLLLRQLGFPARYAVGYAVHEGSGRKFVVRLRDAHAWCLVWNPATATWQDCDFTPPSWIEREAARAPTFQFLSDAWWRLMFELSKLRWGQSHLREYLLWSLAPVLALLLYQILFRRRRRRGGPAQTASPAVVWPGLDSEFYQLETWLAARSVPRQTGEPLSDWLARAAQDPALGNASEPLRSLLRLHYRYRFDPHGLTADERETLRREARSCLATFARA